MEAFSSVINGATQLLGTGLDAWINYNSQKRQNKANMDLAKYSHDLNMSAWHEQQDYNNPSNTMQRLTDAGINPRAFQQLGQFANSGEAPQFQKPDYNDPNANLARFNSTAQSLMSTLRMYYDLRDKMADIKTKEAAIPWLGQYYQNRNKVQSLNADFIYDKSLYQQVMTAIMADGYGIKSPDGSGVGPYRLAEKYRGIKADNDLMLANLRALEFRWKHDRYDFFQKTGFDTETQDSLTTLLRVLLRNVIQ